MLPCQGEGYFSPASVMVSFLLSHLKWVSSTVVASRVQVQCSCGPLTIQMVSGEDTLHLTTMAWGRGHATPCLLPAHSWGVYGVQSWTRTLESNSRDSTVLSLMAFHLSSTAGKIIKGRKERGFKNKAKQK